MRIVTKRCREMAGVVTDRWPALLIHNRIKHFGHCVEQLRSKRWPLCGCLACDIEPRKRLLFWEGGIVYARPSRNKGEREVEEGHLVKHKALSSNSGRKLCEQSEDVHHVRRTKGVQSKIE